MPNQESVTHWIASLKQGDAAAAEELWRRYFHRLVTLTRQKLRGRVRRVADEEDVALSVFESVFRGAREGRFGKLEDRDDLWQLLVMIAARKVANQLRDQTRQKRGGGAVRGESVFEANQSAEISPGIQQVMGTEPTPALAAEVAEQCEQLLERLDDDQLRDIARLKLEGYTNKEIAEQLSVQTRTIERKLALIRKSWNALTFD